VHVHVTPDYHRQRFVATYVLPDRLGRELGHRYSSISSLAPARRALRQWLRLHILAPEALVLPSEAVFVLWRDFVNSKAFPAFSQHAYGHIVARQPDVTFLRRRPDFSDTGGLALTFGMACVDEGLDTPHPMRVPLLFTIDSALGIDDGQHWVLNCGHSTCHAGPGARCTFHELGPEIPGRLPKEIRFGLPEPFRLEGNPGAPTRY
jgi:hypothetical protein